jgi:hypothetical protein
MPKLQMTAVELSWAKKATGTIDVVSTSESQD